MKQAYTRFIPLSTDETYESHFSDMLNGRAEEKMKYGESIGATRHGLETAAILGLTSIGATKKSAMHWFLPGKDFCDWLCACQRIGTAKDVVSIIEQARQLRPYNVFHFPAKAGYLSFATAFFANKTTEYMTVSACFSGGDKNIGMSGVCNYANDPNKLLPCRNANFKINGIVSYKWAVELSLNVLVYASCFPDYIISGTPGNLFQPWTYTGKKVTVYVAPEVVTRDGVTPHYRVGHFRLLSSERFVNKKGQIVFVHGTFVKGHAKTVLEPA